MDVKLLRPGTTDAHRLHGRRCMSAAWEDEGQGEGSGARGL